MNIHCAHVWFVILALFVSIPNVSEVLGVDQTTSESWRRGRNNLCNNKVVAHALGVIDNRDYTNTREAFLASYALGFRVFEIDLTLTADRTLIARHDGNMFGLLGQNLPERIRDSPSEPPTLAEVVTQPILGKYTTMTIKEVVALMAAHPDTIWITDTKYTDREKIRQQFSQLRDAARYVDETILSRVIPQIYHQGMLEEIDAIYVFPDVIYTLYLSSDTDEAVVAFVRDQPRVVAVTMPIDRALPSFIGALNRIKVGSYAHTVNDPKVYQQLIKAGVTGIYTDHISPISLQQPLP